MTSICFTIVDAIHREPNLSTYDLISPITICIFKQHMSYHVFCSMKYVGAVAKQLDYHKFPVLYNHSLGFLYLARYHLKFNRNTGFNFNDKFYGV